MNTAFMAPTFMQIATLASSCAAKNCSQYQYTGNYDVTNPGFWYSDAEKFLRENPSVETDLTKLSSPGFILSEVFAMFRVSFATACAAYFTALKKA